MSQAQRMKSLRLFLCLLVCLATVALAEIRSDPKGLITYDLPAGWTLKSEEFGSRYVPVGKKGRTTIGVTAEQQSGPSGYNWRRKITLSQLKSQNVEIVHDKKSFQDGFERWEIIAKGTSGPVRHIVYYFAGKLEVSVYLLADQDQYESHLGDFQRLVDSVKRK